MILVDVHSTLGRALKGNTGAGEFGKTVDIEGLNSHGLFDALTHFLTPGLSTENTGFERNIIRTVTHFLHALAQVSSVAWCAAENGGI